jgi:hypothetical protein
MHHGLKLSKTTFGTIAIRDFIMYGTIVTRFAQDKQLYKTSELGPMQRVFLQSYFDFLYFFVTIYF